MTKCFCGCGREVGGFMNKRKSANSLGRLSEELAQQVREIPVAADAPPESIDFASKRLASVEAASILCREVVHEERDFADVDWPSIRAQIKDVQGFVAYVRAKTG